MANLLVDQQRLVLVCKAEAVMRHVLVGDDSLHPGQFFRRRSIDLQDSGVGVLAAQNSGVQHARTENILAILRFAGHLQHGVVSGETLSDHVVIHYL
jgi:hypothetical protein